MMYLSLAVVGVRTFALARAALRYAERWLSHDAILGTQGVLRGRIYRGLIETVPGKNRVNLGDLSSRVIQDVDELPNLPLRVILPLVQSIAVSLLSVVLFALILPTFAIWLALALAIAFVIALPLSSLIARAADRASANDRASLTELANSLVNSSTLIANLGWQTVLLKRLEDLERRISTRAMQTTRALSLGQAFFGFAGQASAVLAAIFGLHQLQTTHSDSLVMLAVYALAPLGVFDIASGAGSTISNWRRYLASAERIQGLLANEISTKADSYASREAIESLILRDVSLGYATSVVHSLNLELRASRSTALVGSNGSGKTSVALALAGLLPISSGQILCNGKPLTSSSALHGRVGYLEQSPSIFAGSLRQNLLIGNPVANDDQLIDVLSRVSLWNMFAERQGLDTELGEQGALISGGEAQRISLARALLADFDVIILDEPGASLPFAQAKSLVVDLLRTARDRKRSVVLITHDKRLAKLTDQVHSLD